MKNGQGEIRSRQDGRPDSVWQSADPCQTHVLVRSARGMYHVCETSSNRTALAFTLTVALSSVDGTPDRTRTCIVAA